MKQPPLFAGTSQGHMMIWYLFTNKRSRTGLCASTVVVAKYSHANARVSPSDTARPNVLCGMRHGSVSALVASLSVPSLSALVPSASTLVPVCLRVCLPVCRSACLSFCLSACLSVSPSVYWKEESIDWKEERQSEESIKRGGMTWRDDVEGWEHQVYAAKHAC